MPNLQTVSERMFGHIYSEIVGSRREYCGGGSFTPSAHDSIKKLTDAL